MTGSWACLLAGGLQHGQQRAAEGIHLGRCTGRHRQPAGLAQPAADERRQPGGPARADQEVVVGARIVEVYDRKDHWYQVLDGLVVGGGGAPGSAELARIRHHSIFRPRGTVS